MHVPFETAGFGDKKVIFNPCSERFVLMRGGPGKKVKRLEKHLLRIKRASDAKKFSSSSVKKQKTSGLGGIAGGSGEAVVTVSDVMVVTRQTSSLSRNSTGGSATGMSQEFAGLSMG